MLEYPIFISCLNTLELQNSALNTHGFDNFVKLISSMFGDNTAV